MGISQKLFYGFIVPPARKLRWAGFFLILLFIPQLSCSSPTDPNDNLQPGRRDYVWSIDSISGPGFPYLQSIWGSSPTDVWGAGFSEDVRDCLWHYDGISWKRATEGTPITVLGNGSKIVGGVWGTAQNDVWAFGGRIFSDPIRIEPFVMHFNGSQWLELLGDKSQMPNGFTDIYGIRKDLFWVSSSDHVSEYKDGVWKKYFIGENYYVQSIEGIGSNVYLMAYPIGVDSLYLMKLRGNNFEVIDRTNLFSPGKFSPNGILFANNKVYTFGYGINSTNTTNEEIDVNNWKNDLKPPPNGGFWGSYKISSKDIWGIGSPSILFQYNGENWQQLFITIQNIEATFEGIWGDGNQIFLCDIENGIIFHGK